MKKILPILSLALGLASPYSSHAGIGVVGVVGLALNDQLAALGLPRVPNQNCVAFITGPGSTSGVTAPQGTAEMGPLDLLIVCDQFTHQPISVNQFDEVSNFLPPG